LAIDLSLHAIGVGAAVGLGLGTAASYLLRACARRGWIKGSWLQVPVLALALLSFASAQWLGGSGFIASFVGGMTFGALTRHDKQAFLEAAEGTGDTLAMLTWFVFGTLLLTRSFAVPDWRMFSYALASLTIVRMLPVFLSTAGLRLRTDTRLFLGWFGPRGLASIVFAVMVLDEHLPNASTLVTTAACTILLSIVAHGLSANYLASKYGARVGSTGI
jgi:NhaP-type Na+/H+ or K+/H+ antiporter